MNEERPVRIRLNPVILAVTDGVPRLLTVRDDVSGLSRLPGGALDPVRDRTLELALRRLVREQTGIELAYVEQLYTFGDAGRDPRERVISIAYLALVRQTDVSASSALGWCDCYELFPWEDRREHKPVVLAREIAPVLERWIEGKADHQLRADITFGLGGSSLDGTRVLERYELLYEVGLVAERARDRGQTAQGGLGLAMAMDHRRMVATALGRIRGKLTYRPVVFELLPETFTLSQLQRVVEALAGVTLHTSNFRRLLEKGGLVEDTGRSEPRTGGRPAKLFRFRREVLRERPAPGVGLPGAR
jgi:hypothetical protein